MGESVKESIELFFNELNQLVLRRADLPDEADVRLRRSFPWTRPDQFISIRTAGGKELALIDRLDDLSTEQRAIVDRWLAQNSFLPAIARVNSINMDFGYQQWDVVTDRGPANFRVQEREDVRFLSDGRFSVKDVDGNVYVLPRPEEMDAHSQRAVQILL
ncbi:MAG: DUF1854 domain-containing protein [Tepidisphaeraceae bacterium]